MESQPQNPEFRINPENFHSCSFVIILLRKRELVSLLFFFVSYGCLFCVSSSLFVCSL